MTADEFKKLHNLTDAQLQPTRDAIERSVQRDKDGFGGCVKDVPWYDGTVRQEQNAHART